MKNDNLFLPVYINKDRLLDINSILFDGYSDFSEMTLESNNDSKKNNTQTDISDTDLFLKPENTIHNVSEKTGNRTNKKCRTFRQ